MNQGGQTIAGADSTGQQSAVPPQHRPSHIKETVISIVIAFILAFVARAFVIEAFIIPTGSMAPTLMGAHHRLTSANSGYQWPVGPQALDARGGFEVHDPMTGERLRRITDRMRAGDRILVYKYLYRVYDPRRFDVVVFKAPHEPHINYIKRLVGLPGEQIALIDGDVFTRIPPEGEAHEENSWAQPGWQIQRKPERVQRTLWQNVFSSEYEPLNPNLGPPIGIFQSPWIGGEDWQIDGRTSYIYAADTPTILRWDAHRWPLEDWYPYNETRAMPRPTAFPVSDLAMSLGLEPHPGAAISASAIVHARGHEFRADVEGDQVTLRMGRAENNQPPTEWTILARGELRRPLQPGHVTNLAFWHYDQRLELWEDQRLIARGDYDWSPVERVQYATTLTMHELVEAGRRGDINPLANAATYTTPQVRWEFNGGPFTIHRVRLDRDVHYQAWQPRPERGPARGTHPLFSPILGPDHFFVCGDNSPASSDSRLWDPPDPWVAQKIDPTEGIVPRDLMIGRAFFVYFPGWYRSTWGNIPIPDFGRLRWIW